MPSTTVTVSSREASRPIPVDLRRHRAGIGLIATVEHGSHLKYSVEITGDKLQADMYNPNSGHWNNHDTMTELTQSKNGVQVFPVTGVRLNVFDWQSGSVTLSVVQAED